MNFVIINRYGRVMPITVDCLPHGVATRQVILFIKKKGGTMDRDISFCLESPSYEEDPVYYHDSRAEYIDELEIRHDDIALQSCRKPSLSEYDRDVS